MVIGSGKSKWEHRFLIVSVAFGMVLAIGSAAWSKDGVGRVALGSLRSPEGKRIDLTPPSNGLAVLIFYSSECPISNAYSPTLNTLAAEFAGRSVVWTGVCVDPDLSDTDVITHARDFALKFRLVRDPRGSLARKLGATMSPEAFVVDFKGVIRYQGRIDDQFVARRVRNANPSSNELKDAISAVLEGRSVKTARVAAIGCPIPLPEISRAKPTYSDPVAAILQKNCQECHRRGQLGPFPLETYEQARKRADDIAAIVQDRSMPPWKAAPDFGAKFSHDRSLTHEQIATLAAWAESGAPEGDPASVPAPPRFPDDWTLEGGADLVLDIGTDFQIPASGEDIYRCFVVPTNMPDDVYVSGIEYRPGNRRVVHHILAYVDVSGEARKKDAADPGSGYECFSGPGVQVNGDLGGWAPGAQPCELPEGIGRKLTRNGDVIIQVHYHASGKLETDRTRIGLRFARKPVRQTLHWNAALDHGLKLPPGKSRIEVKAAWPVPVDVVAHGVSPHMHLLGKDMVMWVEFPDGRKLDLIKINDWDFNWQYQYYFQKPIDLPKGSVLRVLAHFDNSEGNPRNPNHPPKVVTWGEATTDEMCIGFIALTKKGQDLTRPGEKDDLRQIFQRQREEFQKKDEEARNRKTAGN